MEFLCCDMSRCYICIHINTGMKFIMNLFVLIKSSTENTNMLYKQHYNINNIF